MTSNTLNLTIRLNRIAILDERLASNSPSLMPLKNCWQATESRRFICLADWDTISCGVGTSCHNDWALRLTVSPLTLFERPAGGVGDGSAAEDAVGD